MKRFLFALVITFTVATAMLSEQTSVRLPPQAKTQAEYSDYKAAESLINSAAMEKAADDFAAKYAASELRSLLYARAMHLYQQENNAPKILAMGEKVLALDPDHPVALVLAATVLADGLSDKDIDRQEKIAKVRKYAGHVLATLNATFLPPAGVTPEQGQAYKNTLSSMAHSALGILDLKTGDDTGAEKELQTASEQGATQQDPYVWYHLALAQDHQQKYALALASVNRALQYTSGNADLDQLARGERDRLSKLVTPQGAPPAPTAPPKSQP
jgi:tetratricopeptide (TPR) repeat protein